MTTKQANGYLNAIPRLRAEENLEFAAAVAVGSGTLEKQAAARIQRQWLQQTEGPSQRRRPVSREEFLGNAAAAGIKVNVHA